MLPSAPLLRLPISAICLVLLGWCVDPARGGEPSPASSWQGEYVGCLLLPTGRVPVGLQISDLGKGEHAGVEYRGGLPGQGGLVDRRLASTGRWQDDLLKLEAPDRLYVGLGQAVQVFDNSGRQIGRLLPVHRTSPTVGAVPPPGAIVLFNGRPSTELKGARLSPEGLLQVGCETTRPFGDFLLHVEFQTPTMPAARGQARGNSGVYVQGRYEVQILDSFGLESQNNDCGALYRQRPPAANYCLPPGQWQSYEIEFRAARFDAAGKKIAPARITVWHNGFPIHCQQELTGKTGAGAAEGPEPRPIKFQDHGDKVLYRNLWILERPAT